MVFKCPSCGELSDVKEVSSKILCPKCRVLLKVSKDDFRKPFYTRGETGVLNSSLYSSYKKDVVK